MGNLQGNRIWQGKWQRTFQKLFHRVSPSEVFPRYGFFTPFIDGIFQYWSVFVTNGAVFDDFLNIVTVEIFRSFSFGMQTEFKHTSHYQSSHFEVLVCLAFRENFFCIFIVNPVSNLSFFLGFLFLEMNRLVSISFCRWLVSLKGFWILALKIATK